MSPALAAPYAALPGDGRRPLTLVMFTIDPPSTWSCMTRLAAWHTWIAPRRLRRTMASVNRADASAAGT